MPSNALAPITASRDPNRPFHPIGIRPDDTGIIYIGKRYPHGFGLDLPFEAERILLAAIASLPPQRSNPFQMFTGRYDFREKYAADITHWFGYSGLPLADVRVNEVYRHLVHLRGQQVWNGLTFAHITQRRNHSGDFEMPLLPVVTRWRYFTFADVIVRDRLVHLRTTEMTDSSAVWDRLWFLFEGACLQLHRQRFDQMKIRDRVREQRSFYLALYERLLYLRYEESTLQPAYRAAITDRHAWPNLADDRILPFHEQLTDWECLGRARHDRRVVYHELLRLLLHRTVDKLSLTTSDS